MSEGKKYRTKRDILIPAGTNVVRVARMKQEVIGAATAFVRVSKHTHFDWIMNMEDALATGLIEEVGE